MKRIAVWTIVSIIALWLLIPTNDIVAPRWTVLVTDTNGRPIPGVSVTVFSQQYTVETQDTEVTKITGMDGLVSFDERRIRAIGLMRLVGVVRNLDQGAHASFGVHTWVAAHKPGYGEPSDLKLFGENERQTRANGKAQQSSHIVLMLCPPGYSGSGWRGGSSMQNYFNYFTEIEERFQRRRGALLLLSTLDWALIETWREAGIPLDAALRGIDAAFDKYEARQAKGRARRINGLAWCSQAVMEAAEELREAAAGTAAAKTDAEAAPESGFEHQRVAAHLESAAAALELAQAAHEACTVTAARLRELAAAVRGDAGASAKDVEAAQSLERLELYLTRLEENLFAALNAAAPDDLVVRIREHADRELAPYKSKMGPVQVRQVKQQFEQKQLLVHYNLPRLSLFYMSQQ